MRYLYGLFFLLLPAALVRGQSAEVRRALVFPVQARHVHASSLVELPGGDLLLAWFEGSGERTADDVRIRGARLRRGETTWSTPFDLADTPGLPDCNPVLFLNGRGTLFLVWIAVQANRWEQSILRVRTSTDPVGPGAPVWNWQDNILLKPDARFADAVRTGLGQLPERQAGWAGYAPEYDEQILAASQDPMKRSLGWMTRIKPLRLPSGRLVLPLYSDGFNLAMMALSDDDGGTWRASSPLVGRGPIQPALGRRRDGTLVAHLRDSGDPPGRVQRSESTDEGETWSPAVRTTLPNTASVEVLPLRDGRWVLVGNDVADGRYRLSLYLSADEGRTWQPALRLEDHPPAPKSGYSYPALIQTTDGLLHLSYSAHGAPDQKSIRHVVLDPARLVARP
jgi:predicted neuraminidase